MKLFVKKTLTGWIPADTDAQEVHRRHKLNEVYKADIVKPRSYQHHKLIMALLSLTWKNLPEFIEINGKKVPTIELWPTFDRFRKSIALSAGHVETNVDIHGEAHQSPGSLAYDALDEVGFTRVAGAMMTICTQILDMSEPELAAEVSRYADEHYGRAA